MMQVGQMLAVVEVVAVRPARGVDLPRVELQGRVAWKGLDAASRLALAAELITLAIGTLLVGERDA